MIPAQLCPLCGREAPSHHDEAFVELPQDVHLPIRAPAQESGDGSHSHTRTRTRDSHTRLALALAHALEDWAVRPTHPLGDPLGCGPHL